MGAATRPARNLIELVCLGQPEAFYARLTAWLLDPAGEHGLGHLLLRRLARAMAAAGKQGLSRVLASDAPPPFKVQLRVREGRNEVVVTALGHDMIVVCRTSRRGYRGELEAYEAAGTPAAGLALTADCFPADVAAAHPVWTFADLVEALAEVEPTSPYLTLVAHFRDHLRARLEDLGQAPPATTAPAAPAAAPPRRPAPPPRPVPPEPSRAALADGAVDRSTPETHPHDAPDANPYAAPEANPYAAPEPAEASPYAAPEPAEASPYAAPEPAGTPEVDPYGAAAAAEPAEGSAGAPAWEAPDDGEPQPSLAEAVTEQVEALLVGAAEAGPGGEPVEGMLVTDDMSRAYFVQEVLAQGTHKTVYAAAVQGEATFEGFDRPVPAAVVKVAQPGHEDAIARELELVGLPDRGLPRLLDAGETEGRPWLVEERLYPTPFTAAGVVDPALATDVFVNLLEVLQDLHLRAQLPLVLANISPSSIMLRVPGAPGPAEAAAAIAEGRYEPVFAEPTWAIERKLLEANQGQLLRIVGDPVYLPPEALPQPSGRVTPATVTPKVDVYALTLAFYAMLTGDRPYARTGFYEAPREERVEQLFALKRKKVSPLDGGLLHQRFEPDVTADLLEVLRPGLNPDPRLRASPQVLARLARKKLRVTERWPRGNLLQYRFDGGLGLRLRQGRFPSGSGVS